MYFENLEGKEHRYVISALKASVGGHVVEKAVVCSVTFLVWKEVEVGLALRSYPKAIVILYVDVTSNSSSHPAGLLLAISNIHPAWSQRALMAPSPSPAISK